MKFKSTFILGILLLVGIVAVYLLDYKAGEEKKAIEKLSSKLIQLDTENIAEIKLTSEYGSVSLTKTAENGFTISSPVIEKGDKNAINSLIRAAENIKKEREIASGENPNLAPYGLESPLVEMQFLLKDGSVTGFSLGEESPTGEYLFASALMDNKVFTVPKSVFPQTNKKLFDLRNKKILSFKRNDISKIFVKTKDYEYEINRLGSEFMMTKPVSLILETNKVNSLLSRLSSERVKKFIDSEQPESNVTGLAESGTEITLESSNPPSQLRLTIGKSLNEEGKAFRYAKEGSRSTILLIDSGFAAFLEKKPFELIKKEVFSFDIIKVDAFDIRYAGVELKLTKDDTLWHVTHPENFMADTDKVDDLLEKFHTLKASAVEEYDPKSFKEYVDQIPGLTIVLYQNSIEANSIRVGKKVGDESFLKSGGSPPVYKVLSSAIEELKVTADYFRKEE